ncbi:transcription initiation factor IIB family protein [Haladaptatus sp. R4]|uniref:transcription initiation factor IIB n=1 Tax=Haladaptatus sp. R4 TaxID=1679489 RepID=UPI0009EEF550|nr:transcription initiation factor IIB [Haladaptatus sp. R4]
MTLTTHQRDRERSTEETSSQARLDQCPECNSEELAHSADQNELICQNCGLILEESNLDHGPEWRAFNQTEKASKSRVGAPITQRMHDKGLTTTIDWKDKDAYGRTISNRKQKQINRLRTWQQRIRTNDSGERNLQFAFSEIDRMASALAIPDTNREVACVIYRRALSEDLLRGRSIEGVATSCLYAACRQAGIPRSLDEMVAVARIGEKELGRTYRYIAQELALEIKPSNPKEFVPRFCSKLGTTSAVENKAFEILNLTLGHGLHSGKSPVGFAAAAIYVASLLCDEKHTQSEVAEAAQVTEVTIRNRYQEQLKAVKEA